MSNKNPGLLAGILFMLVCFLSVLTKASRTISKIVAKIKEAMVAFVIHLNIKINKTTLYKQKNPS
jgi:hypothetical protein